MTTPKHLKELLNEARNSAKSEGWYKVYSIMSGKTEAFVKLWEWAEEHLEMTDMMEELFRAKGIFTEESKIIPGKSSHQRLKEILSELSGEERSEG